MGSTETPSRAVDSSVGSIVWVRRRNGSWWPGKILGQDEMLTPHLTSPRSGTPVKLLGREDASVDWYNLEKSKRVKSFRCGEFDQCISRAEASRGLPPKKREKYAHREDAILHALELEKQLLEKKYGKVTYSHNDKQNGSPDAAEKDLVISRNFVRNGGAKQVNCKSNQDAGIHSSLVEMDINGHGLDSDTVKEVYQVSGDGDHSSSLNNFTNLEDFGHLISVDHVYLPSEAPNDSPAPTPNNTVHRSPGRGTSIIDVKSNSLLKKQDKHQPLVQLLQNSSRISQSEPNMDASTSVPRGEQEGGIHHPKRSRYTYVTADLGGSPVDNRSQGQMVTSPNKLNPGNSANLCEESTSDSAEDTETDASDSQTTESDTDDVLSDDAASIGLEPKYPGSIGSYADYGSVSSEDHNVSDSYYDKPVSASEGVSRWQLRRKRNNDSTMKRSLDPAERNPFGGTLYKEHFTEKRYTGFNDSDDIKQSSKARTLRYGSRGFDSTTHDDPRNLEKLAGNQTATKGWEEAGEFFGPAYTFQRQLDERAVLIDVNLQVKSSYQRPHVPFISLTSKMSGHAIVGYPVQIEYLENGSSDSFFDVIDEYYPEVSDYSTAVGPVWRTGRRTANSRVPRSHPSSYPTSDLDGESAVNIQVGIYDDGKVSFGKPKIGAIGPSASMMKNNIANSLLENRHSKKQPKKNGMSCNKKVRTLSSLTSEQNQSTNLKCGGKMYMGSGLIKPDSVLKAVPCIPVKLVFTRLHEELFGLHQ